MKNLIGLFLVLILLFGGVFGGVGLFMYFESHTPQQSLFPNQAIVSPTLEPTSTPSPSSEEVKTSSNYGQVKDLGNDTYTADFQADSRMTTPQELLDAVNSYRQEFGKAPVSWNSDLANWAQSRSDFYIRNGDIDEHAGFLNQAPSMYQTLHFQHAGEDAEIGGKPLFAVHIIEWTYAKDASHRDQLLGDYNALGVGVSSNGTLYANDLIFAKY